VVKGHPVMPIPSEDDLLRTILKYLDRGGPGERLDPGDDARDILPRGLRIVFTMDGYSIGSAWLPWRGLDDIGYSILAGSISDLVSKSACPYGFMTAIGVPVDWEIGSVEMLYRGFREACRDYWCRLLGGDTNRSGDPWVAVAGIGFTTAAYPPRRDGARPGDYVVATGYYGAMGVVAVDGVEEASRHRWVVMATRRPKVYVQLAPIIASYSKIVHASMDVSDGLAYTLYTVARGSGVCIELGNLPQYHLELRSYCRGDEQCMLERIMYGGEEYGAVLTIDPGYIGRFTGELDSYGVPYRVIGRVVECREPLITYGGKEIEIHRWDQFKGWIKLD